MDAGGDGDGMCFPYDVLLDILRRLPGRDIAASQCVCRAWQAMVDAHGLSLERYFPRRAFPGLFVNKTGCHSQTSFFAPPATHGEHPVYPQRAEIYQSCNGLVLLEEWDGHLYVLNPATARYARLPWPSTPWYDYGVFLAFDPAVSLHFHVFRFQAGPGKAALSAIEHAQGMHKAVEDPKENVLPMLMYSSCTGQWEKRVFRPGRCAPGHLYDAVRRLFDMYADAFYSCDYWRGCLYVHCRHNGVLLIIRPSHGTYDMVQLPGKPCFGNRWHTLPVNSVLASYERGVHYVDTDTSQLRVWILTESAGAQLGWTLAHDVSLKLHGHVIQTCSIPSKVTWRTVGSRGGPISLDDDDEVDEDRVGAYDSEYSWDSDEDNFVDVVRRGADHHELQEHHGFSYIMGFHPHKNALVLMLSCVVVEYHLDTSRMQYLGDANELLKDNVERDYCVDNSFIYRPCYEDVLPTGKLSMSL